MTAGSVPSAKHRRCRPIHGQRVSLRFIAIAGLAVLVFAAFLPALDNGFVFFDDDVYILNNPQVRGGLSLEGVRWAFTTIYAGNWHPVTWLSHMLDVSLFGLQPQGHHLVGMLLHATTALLALGVLRGMTGLCWPSMFAAALFAVHPLRVESVAWAAERKDLLSGLFWMLALGAYHLHVRSPAPRRMALVVMAMVAGLLAKPMGVTLPFALLILDWWPLGRLRTGSIKGEWISVRALCVEKWPLFVVSALFAIATLYAQNFAGATTALSPVPWGARLVNAVVACASYLAKTIWPVQLSVFYPHPEGYRPVLVTVAAVAVFAALSLVAGLARRRAPAIAAGWLWFLVTLVPVIGLIQVGYQAMADRYTYLPSLGIAMAMVWGVRQLVPSRTVMPLAVAALPLCVALVLLTRNQTRLWRDTRTLFGHALAINEDNWLGHLNYGAALADEGRFSEALPHYRDVLRLQPFNAKASNNLGVALNKLGRVDEGMEFLRRALVIDPSYVEAHYNLGVALHESGLREQATNHFAQVLRRQPGHRDALYNLGVLAGEGGRFREAENYYRRAVAVDPEMVNAHLNLGVALARLGMNSGAEHHLREALRLDPENPAVRDNLRQLMAAASAWPAGHPVTPPARP